MQSPVLSLRAIRRVSRGEGAAICSSFNHSPPHSGDGQEKLGTPEPRQHSAAPLGPFVELCEAMSDLDPLQQRCDVNGAAAVRRRSQRIVRAGRHSQQHLQGRLHGMGQSLEMVAPLQSEDETTLT